MHSHTKIYVRNGQVIPRVTQRVILTGNIKNELLVIIIRLKENEK